MIIETEQSRTTARIQLKLVEQMNQTFSAIVSNNLNNIMKILTSLTIILTIPTIIGSLYGMNIKASYCRKGRCVFMDYSTDDFYQYRYCLLFKKGKVFVTVPL